METTTTMEFDLLGGAPVNVARRCVVCGASVAECAWVCGACAHRHALGEDMGEWPDWAKRKVHKAFFTNAMPSAPPVPPEQPRRIAPGQADDRYPSEMPDPVAASWEYIRVGML
jgi:hypothetical protein